MAPEFIQLVKPPLTFIITARELTALLINNRYLHQCAEEVVDAIYHEMSYSDLEDLISSDTETVRNEDDVIFEDSFYEFCICKEGGNSILTPLEVTS